MKLVKSATKFVQDVYVNEVKEVQEINEINDRIKSLKNTIAILESKKDTINAIHISVNVSKPQTNYNLTPVLGI